MNRAATPWAAVIRPSAAWRGVQALLAGLGSGVSCAWALQWLAVLQELYWPVMAWLAAAIGVACLVAGVTWRLCAAQAVELRFDGADWHLDGQPGALEVKVDLDDWLLLRHRAAGSRQVRWFAASRASTEQDWHGLRVALYSRPPVAPAVAPRG